MYNFFAKRINKKAFIQALKEVEKEGYYVSQDLSKDMVFTTNMSRAVAALSDEQIKVKQLKDKTLDVSKYAPNIDSEAETERVKPASADVLEEKVFTKQSRAQMYEKMFADDTLLNGEHIKEWGVLSDETAENEEVTTRAKAPVSVKQDKEDEKIKQKAKKLFAELNKNLEAKQQETINAKEIHEEAVDEQLETQNVEPVEEKVEAETNDIVEEETAVESETPKLVVEVVAKDPETIEEPAQEEQSIVEVPVVVSAQVPVVAASGAEKISKPKIVVKPKTQRTRKKRRRYDADIAGGFDF